MFVSFDELPEEETPPREIWLDPDRLKTFFDNVKKNREEKSKGKQIEDPVENQAAKDLIVGN